MGQDRSTCTPHLVVLITPGSRSVFRRECSTETSRRGHKRELPHHTSVTSSCCLKTHAMEGRSTHEGKVAVSLSASLPGCVNHAGRGFFWSEKAEKKGQPLTLWILLLTGSIPLVFFSSSSQRGSARALVSGTRVS